MPTSRRSQALPGAAAVAAAAPVGAVLLLVAAAVALAVHGGLDRAVDPVSALVFTDVSGPAAVLRAVVLAATAFSAGLGLVAGFGGGFSGSGPAGAVRAAWSVGSITAAACVLEVVNGAASRPVAAVHAVAALLIPVLLGSSRVGVVRASVVVGLVLAVLLGVALGPGRTGLPLALDLLYAVAMSMLSGAVLVGHRAGDGVGGADGVVGASAIDRAAVGGAAIGGAARGTDRSGDREQRGAARLVVSSGVLAAGAGLAQLALTGPPAGFDVTHTGYGLAGLAQAGIPLLVAATWPAAERLPAARPATVFVVAAVLAVVAASVPATLPPPAAAPEPGRPSARPAELPGRHLAVLVAPMRPGPNLVHLAAAERVLGEPTDGQHHGVSGEPAHGHDHGGPATPAVSFTVDAGGAEVPLAARTGATGLWAVLDIPSGTDRITVTESGIDGAPGRYAADVPVDVGTSTGDPALTAALTGPDGPECASALLGGLLAGQDTTAPSQCPSQTLTSADAGALRDTVTFLADREIAGLALVADDSARGRAAAELVRTEAAARDLPVRDGVPGDTLLVVSGWSQAPPVLGRAEALARETATGGIVLAPWLLSGPVLAAASAEVLALPFDPGETAARHYGARVAAAFPGDGPSAAGYLAWLQAGGSGGPLPPRAAFYGAAPVNVPMGMAGMDHGPGSGSPGAWYPSGAVVPISPPLGPPGATP
ncbi:MAG: hypothetical protein AB7G09_20685 [Pseudonocardia sp.]